MAIPSQLTTIPIGAGVDRRSHPERVAPPKLLKCDDATWGDANVGSGTAWAGNGLQRRAGYTADATIYNVSASPTASAVRGLANLRGALYAQDANYLWLRNESFYFDWSVIGPSPTCSASYEKTASSPVAAADVVFADSAGNATSTAFVIERSTGTEILIRDAAGGQWSDTSAFPGVSNPRIVMNASGSWAAIGVSGTNLEVASGSGGNLIGHTLVSDLDASGLYDAKMVSDTIFLAYRKTGTNDIKYGTYSMTWAPVVSLATETAPATPSTLACAVSDDGVYAGIAWNSDATPTVRARVFLLADLSAVNAQTEITAPAGSPTFVNIGAGFSTQQVSAGTTDWLLHVAWEIAGTETYQHRVHHGHLAATVAATTGLATAYYDGVGLASHPWAPPTADSKLEPCAPNIILVHESALQSTYVVARLAADMGSGATGPTLAAVLGRLFPGTAKGLHSGHLVSVEAHDTGIFRFPARVVTADTDKVVVWPVLLDFNDIARWVDCGAASFGTGVSLWRADDSGMVEAGFGFFPENVTIASNAAGGSVTSSGTYGVMVIAEWTGAAGEREQSSGVPVTITTGASDTRIVVTLDNDATCYSLTNKRSDGWGQRALTLAIYRTTDGGLNYYREGTVAAGISTYNCDLSDTALAANEPLYFTPGVAGSALDNIPPPTPSVIAAGNNRVVVAGAPSAETIYVSKYRDILEPLAFADALTAAVDAANGALTALAYLGDTLIAFRANQIYQIAGEGPDNTGSGGAFIDCRLVSSDIGCTDARTLVRMPMGLMFYSSLTQQIQLLDPSLNLTNVGADIEGYLRDNTNSDQVTPIWATHDPLAKEVRFGDASRQLVYNYERQAWVRWQYGGLSAVQIGSRQYVLTSTAGAVSYYDPAANAYQDPSATAITTTIRWPWIAVRGLGGHERLRKIVLTFDRQDGFLGTFKIRYDGSETVTDTFTRTTASGDRKIELRPSIQRCSTFSLELALSSTSTLSPVLHELVLELGAYPLAKGTDPSKRAT